MVDYENKLVPCALWFIEHKSLKTHKYVWGYDVLIWSLL